MEDSEEQRTVWIGNLSDKVTEELLYELFLQAAPLLKVRIPKDKEGRQLSYGFVTFKHLVSVQYATELLNGTTLYDRRINIKPRLGNFQRQNSHQRDHSPIYLHNRSTNLQNDLNLLMQMTNQSLKNDLDSTFQNLQSSTPYRRWDGPNQRCNDYQPNRRQYNRNRRTERFNSENHRGKRRRD